MTHGIPIIIISLYIVLLFAVTFWSQRLTAKNQEGFIGYLLAGRSLPPIVSRRIGHRRSLDDRGGREGLQGRNISGLV